MIRLILLASYPLVALIYLPWDFQNRHRFAPSAVLLLLTLGLASPAAPQGNAREAQEFGRWQGEVDARLGNIEDAVVGLRDELGQIQQAPGSSTSAEQPPSVSVDELSFDALWKVVVTLLVGFPAALKAHGLYRDRGATDSDARIKLDELAQMLARHTQQQKEKGELS